MPPRKTAAPPSDAPDPEASLPSAALRPAPKPVVHDVLDAAAEAALALAVDRPWDEISLRDIARAADVELSALYARAPGKDAVLQHLSRRFDAAALASGAQDESAEVHDRLFEAVMARLETMAAQRAVLITVARARGLLALLPHLPRTAKALLEAAGVDTTGRRGALRIAGMTRVWGRTLQVWRDDEGALNRTMAEIDQQLRTLNRRLGRVRAGF